MNLSAFTLQVRGAGDEGRGNFEIKLSGLDGTFYNFWY